MTIQLLGLNIPMVLHTFLVVLCCMPNAVDRTDPRIRSLHTGWGLPRQPDRTSTVAN